MSSVAEIINKIKEQEEEEGDLFLSKINHPPLDNYVVGHDGLRRKVYVTAVIKPKALDKGDDLTFESRDTCKAIGYPDDEPSQIIPKRLGGFNDMRNGFPRYKDVRFRCSNLNYVTFSRATSNGKLMNNGSTIIFERIVMAVQL